MTGPEPAITACSADVEAKKVEDACPNVIDSAALWRIQQIGRTIASTASVGLVYLCVSSGIFSVGLEPTDSGIDSSLGLDTDNRKHGTTGLSPLPDLAVPCIGLIVAATVGIFLAAFPDRVSHGSLWKWRVRSWNPPPAVQVVFSCSLFMVVGPSLMLMNKQIMQGLGFRYPLSLSLLGLLTCAVFSRLVCALGLATVKTESLEAVAGYRWFQIAMPIGLCKALTLAFGNAVYLHLGLGFIQMLKAFTPVVVLVVMRIFGTAVPSRATTASVFLIVAGTLVEVEGELHATAIGLFLMFASEFTEAINLVLTQKLLQSNKFSIMEGMYILAPPGAVCLLTLAAALEWPSMINAGDHLILRERPLWFFGAAVLGLLVNFTGFFVVQATSSLTVKILNQARCIGLIIVGLFWYGEVVSSFQAAGYSIAVVGFIAYNWLQVFPDSGEKLERAMGMHSSPR